jgi:hypothetical protein
MTNSPRDQAGRFTTGCMSPAERATVTDHVTPHRKDATA